MSAIRISKGLARAARNEAELMRRSIARQVEHWAEIGRAVESCMSVLETRALFARAERAARTLPSIGMSRDAGHKTDGTLLYHLRIRQDDPMLGVIADSGDASVVKAKQGKLLSAKHARQLIDGSPSLEEVQQTQGVLAFEELDATPEQREGNSANRPLSGVSIYVMHSDGSSVHRLAEGGAVALLPSSWTY